MLPQSYKRNKEYKVSKRKIDIILNELSSLPYKYVLYMGYADKDLTIALKDKYKIKLDDWFDRTNKITAFWCDGMTDDGMYILDGAPIELNIPKWAEDIPVLIEGIPGHQVLILDIPLEWKIYPSDYIFKPAEVVFVLGDAHPDNFRTDYDWSYCEGVWIGRSAECKEKKRCLIK